MITSNDDLILQRPEGPAQQLFLLFHGLGAEPESMAALGKRLAAAFPRALVVCIAAPDQADGGRGRQWFSARDVTEEDRPARVAATMTRFVQTVRAWQRESGLGAAATALVGFSQGAIMALEALKTAPDLAGRVLAFGGRFAALPEAAFPRTTIHLLHGKTDTVVPYAHTIYAAHRLLALGSDVTADVQPHVGHTMDATLMETALQRLRFYAPKWMWEEALQASPELRVRDDGSSGG